MEQLNSLILKTLQNTETNMSKIKLSITKHILIGLKNSIGLQCVTQWIAIGGHEPKKLKKKTCFIFIG